MTLYRESYLYHLWRTLCAAWEESGLHRLFERLGGWCSEQIDTSALLRPLCREGRVAKGWADSLLCRIVSFLINLPILLLQSLYRALQPTFEDSFFARLVFAVGEETAVVQSWLIMLLWCIPYEYWNNAYTLMAFVFLLLVFCAGAMRREAYRFDVKTIGFYPLVLFGAIFLGVVFSYTRSQSPRFLVYHIAAALCVLVTVSAVHTARDMKRLAAGGSVCVAVSSLYAIMQRMQGLEVNKSYVDLKVNADMPSRVMSFFDNPNAYAEVLMMLLPLTIALVLCSRSGLGKLAAFGAMALGVIALGMTYGRASWIGFACAMAVMVFLWKPKLIPLFILLCIAAVPFLPASIWNRILTITNMEDTSTASRIPLYETAIKIIKKSPVAGAGLGTAAVQSFVKRYKLYWGHAPFVHAHNIYLQVWIEAGILGLLGFVSAMLWNIKRAAHVVRHSGSSEARTLTCGAAAALCGAMVCGLADYLWNYPRVMCIFWFVFAMALAGARLCAAGEEA